MVEVTVPRRPWPLVVVPVALVGIALGLPIQIMMIYEYSLWDVSGILSKLTWLNWVCIALILANAYLLYEAHRLVHWTVPISIIVITLNNWFVAHSGVDFSMLETALSSLGYLTLHGLLLGPGTLKVLNDQKMCWWKTAKRSQVSLPVSVLPHLGDEIETSTFDLSATGLYIPYESERENGAVPKSIVKATKEVRILPGSLVTLRITLDQLRSIRCEGKVVRAALASGIYPAGLGIEFSKMPHSDRRRLASFLRRCKTQRASLTS